MTLMGFHYLSPPITFGLRNCRSTVNVSRDVATSEWECGSHLVPVCNCYRLVVLDGIRWHLDFSLDINQLMEGANKTKKKSSSRSRRGFQTPAGKRSSTTYSGESGDQPVFPAPRTSLGAGTTRFRVRTRTNPFAPRLRFRRIWASGTLTLQLTGCLPFVRPQDFGMRQGFFFSSRSSVSQFDRQLQIRSQMSCQRTTWSMSGTV